MKSNVFKILSLIFFIVPPSFFIFYTTKDASVLSTISLSALLVLIIALLLVKHFLIDSFVSKSIAMVTQWEADFKVETDATKKDSLLREIKKRNYVLLGLKIPFPALLITAMYLFLKTAEQACHNVSFMLGICSAFWIVAVALLFVAVAVRKK